MRLFNKDKCITYRKLKKKTHKEYRLFVWGMLCQIPTGKIYTSHDNTWSGRYVDETLVLIKHEYLPLKQNQRRILNQFFLFFKMVYLKQDTHSNGMVQSSITILSHNNTLVFNSLA
jgi:hypothetical protein